MERYALRIPSQPCPAPPGTRILRASGRESHGRLEISTEVLPVLALQGIHVYHYICESVLPVQPTIELMAQAGWRYKHLEFRYAPIYLTPAGQLSLAEPEDLSWKIVPPELPPSQLELLIHQLELEESARLNTERQVEEIDQVTVEGD